jgi:hypothetical protein
MQFIYLDQFRESTILTNETVEFKEKLMEWLPEGGKWRICWRGTEHGWGGSTFHSKCDGKTPTLVIIKVVKDPKNLIFGGYSTETWAVWKSKFQLIIVLHTDPKKQVQKRLSFLTLNLKP